MSALIRTTALAGGRKLARIGVRVAAPALALAGAAAVIAPSAADGFTLTGWSLDLTQRTFRVFNNFTDTEANNNTTPDPNFPGATGAVLALWKASVEWSAALHGDGNGDPSQPNGLGSGGANFDPSYQGLATNPGATGDNIMSELSGCSGGTLAFTESFTNGAGWRMLFYACWTWIDGPGTNWNSGGGRFDLQGVATHEYGHATGMGHSTVNGATMLAATSDGKQERSIAPDDIAGIQSNYGVAAATKPRITGLSWDGAQLTIDGTNFTATNNRVWFTRAGTGTTDAVTVTGLASTNNGTRIVVTPPANAGSGDVLVRRGSSGNASLSQPYPWDRNVTVCPAVTRYCNALPTPAGFVARINMIGSQSVSANDFTLQCSDAPVNTFGLFFYSLAQANVPGGDGVICVGAPFYRLPPVQADFFGQAFYSYDLTAPPVTVAAITPGSTWNFSFWFRQTSPAGYNFSDAISVPFCN
ncbi:MAG: matrixin family metalloprotease [Planctomycetota bacterium]